MVEARKVLGDDVIWCSDLYHAAEGADAVALVTEWNEFRLPDWTRIGARALFDGRNIYDDVTLHKNGITYYGIGTIQPSIQKMITI